MSEQKHFQVMLSADDAIEIAAESFNISEGNITFYHGSEIVAYFNYPVGFSIFNKKSDD